MAVLLDARMLSNLYHYLPLQAQADFTKEVESKSVPRDEPPDE